jgi:hypothetical protein
MDAALRSVTCLPQSNFQRDGAVTTEQQKLDRLLAALENPGRAQKLPPFPEMGMDRDRTLNWERTERLEEALGGLRRSQNWMFGTIMVLTIFVVGFGVYELQRMNDLGEKTIALPREIRSDLHDLTKTLAESSAAAKQQTVQVTMSPPPQQQPTPNP